MSRNAVAAFFAVFIFAPLLWMLMDRDAPFVREAGQIIPAQGEHPECMPLTEDPSGLAPGACVGVTWSIRVVRNCRPSTDKSITRSITDSTGVRWAIGPVPGLFGTTRTPPPNITRHFRIPAGAARGPAVYHSTASFACNPLQQYLWPIVIDRPDIHFMIE